MLSFLVAATVWQPQRPNIVMIFSDDHARQAISAYGSKLITTPHIDRLVREGVRFDRHYTTNPICAPSRATLLTGKYSHLNGLKDNGSVFDGSQETFPKLLQGAGYQTGMIGKWHLASDPTGFDYWEVLPGQGAYYNPEFLTPRGKITEHGYVTEVITKKAIQWLGASRDKSFFLLVGHKAPHRSWIPGLNQLSLFNNKVFPEPPTLRTDFKGLNSAAQTVGMRLDKNIRPADDLMVDRVPPRMDAAQRTKWQSIMASQDKHYKNALSTSGDLLGTNYQRYMKEYLRCVAGVDESVGAIYSYLKSKNMLKNTIIIYASDQGFFLGENSWYDKRWFYEASAGTPLIFRPAGTTRSRKTVGTLTSNLDLAPTILDLAGIETPGAMQGSSLAPILRGKATDTGSASVYGHFYESNDGEHHVPKYVAITTLRYKLIYYYELDEWELFDLSIDPYEVKNLWSRGVPPEVRSELLRKLVTQQRDLNEDPVIIDRVQSAVKGLHN